MVVSDTGGVRLLSAVLVAAAIPVALPAPASIPLSPADVLAPVALMMVLAHRHVPRSFLLWLAAASTAIAIAALGALLVSTDDSPILPLASALYYVKPWIYFFAAVDLGRRLSRAGLIGVLRAMAGALSLVTVVVLAAGLRLGSVTITQEASGGGLVTGFAAGFRDPTTLALYGNGQVNSTAALLFMLTPIVAFLYSLRRRRTDLLLLLPLGLSWYLIFVSGSRSAAVALVLFVFVCAAFWVLPGRDVLNSRTFRVGLVLLAIPAILWSMSVAIPKASPKYAISAQLLSEASFEDLTSGRAELSATMVSDIGRSPLVGTMFLDFRRFHRDADFVDTSPHNHFLGAFHKAGIIGGSLFLALTAAIMMSARRGYVAYVGWPLVIAASTGILLTMDGLTTPVFSAVLLTILGLNCGFVPDREKL